MKITMNQKGFTLLELLMALAIGAIILLAAYNVFVSQQKSHKLQSELVDAEQNARAALDLLTREMRLAGAGVQRAILTANVAAGASTLSVVSSTGFNMMKPISPDCLDDNPCDNIDNNNKDVINIAQTGKSEAATVNAVPTATPFTTLTLSSGLTNSYTSDAGVFKERIISATNYSISFNAMLSTQETTLTSGYTTGNTLSVVNASANGGVGVSKDTFIFMDDGGGKSERRKISENPASPYATITLYTPLLNSYQIGSRINKGTSIVTYAFDSPNDRITRCTLTAKPDTCIMGSGICPNGTGSDVGSCISIPSYGKTCSGSQPFVENIDYFQIKYYDENNNLIKNPSPYTGVNLNATERSKIRKVNIQIVAISSKDDTSHTETGTYEDGKDYVYYKSTNRRRLFLESDILLTNMAP